MGVEVAWALTWATSGGGVRVGEGGGDGPGHVAPVGFGLGDVVGVGGQADTGRLAVDAAPRAAACSADSSTRTPAPSPITKPSRPLS